MTDETKQERKEREEREQRERERLESEARYGDSAWGPFPEENNKDEGETWPADK